MAKQLLTLDECSNISAGNLSTSALLLSCSALGMASGALLGGSIGNHYPARLNQSYLSFFAHYLRDTAIAHELGSIGIQNQSGLVGALIGAGVGSMMGPSIVGIIL